MSFVNLTRTGFQQMSKHGKLIGTGKNNGIKVFEKLEGDGRRILTSLDKEGNLQKCIETDKEYSALYRKVNNFKTGTEVNSSHRLNPQDGIYYYKYRKVNNSGDNHAVSTIDRFELIKSSDDFKSGSLKSLRKDKKEAFQNKDNIENIVVEQEKGDASCFRLEVAPKDGYCKLQTNGDFKINDEIILPNGESRYRYTTDGIDHVYPNNNVHEANIAKAFIEGLQKIWTK